VRNTLNGRSRIGVGDLGGGPWVQKLEKNQTIQAIGRKGGQSVPGGGVGDKEQEDAVIRGVPLQTILSVGTGSNDASPEEGGAECVRKSWWGCRGQ